MVRYISYYRIGKVHDYRFLKEEFTPNKNWFENYNIMVDSGFLGIMKDYRCKSIMIPHKKPKNEELTYKQKKENKVISSKRIIIEHCIRGIKRYRILSDRLRLHDIDLYNNILCACAGLWNFYLDN